MKIISQQLIFLTAIFASLFASAQNTCESFYDVKELEYTIQPKEITTINNQINLNFSLEKFDDFTITSVEIITADYFTLASHSLVSGQYFQGSTESHTLTLNYDSTNLPYYRKELKAYISTETGADYVSVWFIYFTPYGTIEISNPQNLATNRRWIIGNEADAPHRIYVPLDSIQTQIDSTLPIKYQTVEGVAYRVPVNVDTTVTDSLSDEMKYKLGRTFRGKVKGRLRYEYVNENGGSTADRTVNLDLNQIKVQIWKYKNWGKDQLLGSGTTNADGTFDIDYDHEVFNTSGNITIYVRFVADNGEVRLVWYNWDGHEQIHDLFTEDRTHNHFDGDRQTFDFGTLFLPQATFFHVFHWAQRSVAFARSELGDFNVDWGTCRVVVAAVGEINLIEPTGGFYRTAGSKFNGSPEENKLTRAVHLSFQSTNFESTTYHEVGHWVQHMVQDQKWQEEAGGTHTYVDNNQHPNQAVTEGFANGFQFIVDSRFFTDDSEAENQRFGGGALAIENYHNVFNGSTIRNDLHPFTSEAMFATALLDLWDSKPKLDSYGNTIPERFVSDWIAGTTTSQESAEFSFKEICEPFFLHRSSDANTIQDFPQYFKVLANETEDCIRRRSIRDVTALNLRNRRPSSTVDFRAISTDNLESNETIQHFDHDLILNASGFAVQGPNPTNYNYTYTEIDVNLVDNDEFSILPLVGPPINGIFNTWDISDPLEVLNDGVLSFNASSLDGFISTSNGPFNVLNTVSETEVCHDINVSDGDFEVGSSIQSSGQHAVVKLRGSALSMSSASPSKLIVNNNSTLIVDKDATLHIWPNTQIILDGPNAVLEIRGRLVLEPGASFAPTGGSNGQGFVLFNITGVSNKTKALEHISVSQNSSITLEAANSNTKVLEVMGDNLWIDPNGTNFSFTLKNGKAVMHQNTFLNLACKTTFNSALVEKHPSASHYTGVFLWDYDYRHVIHNSTFKDASEGLHFVGLGGNSYLYSTDNEFINNYNGLTVRGGGFYAVNANASNNNGYGILAYGIKKPSRLYTSDVSYNNVQGLRYESNVGSGLVMDRDNLLQNFTGMKFISTGNLNMSCTQIHGISSFGSPTGLEFFSGSLLMSPQRLTGPNSFINNEVNIAFRSDWGQYAKFDINNGINRLSNKEVGSPANVYAMYGMVDNGGGAYKTVNLNNWDKRNYAPSNPTGPASNFNIVSSSFENYALKQPFISGSFPVLSWITLQDASPRLSSSTNPADITFASNWAAVCPTPLKEKRSFAGLGDIFPDTEGSIINSPTFNGMHLSKCVETVLVNSADTLTGYIELINQWNELLTYTGFSNNLTQIDEYYLDIASTQMMEVVGNYLLNEPLVSPAMLNQVPVQNAANVCAFWENKLQNETSDYSRRFRNKMHLKKGHLFYMVDDNQAALSQFGAIQAWGDSFAIAESNYWLCQINQIEQLKASNFNVSVLQGLPTCEYEQENALLLKRTAENEVIKPVFENMFSIYPNPAKNYFVAVFKMDEEEEVAIILLDVLGKQVADFGKIETFVGENRARISTSGIRAGTYFVQLSSKEGVQQSRLVLID